jgi:predicted small lipoprotein YifL
MRPTRFVLLVAVALLGGCGQKGPLYLPDKNAAVVTPSAAPPGAAPVTTTNAPAPQESAPAPPQTAPAKKPNQDQNAQPPQ